MKRDWKPGEGEGQVWLVEAGCWANPKIALRLFEGWSHTNGVHVDGDGVIVPVRPLLVLDPEDRALIERLRDMTLSALRRHLGFGADEDPQNFTEGDLASAMQAALRELVEPTKVYREDAGGIPPWPVLNECHSSHVDGHECPQCAWEHEHDWVAWTSEARFPAFRDGIPIRCSKCGGRKCDHEACAQRRHTHTHAEDDL